MLRLLKIENIAVIESAEIELGNGFNVLTGETGAGKSILIDSLNAVLGARTSKDIIRTGEKNASVSALFDGFDDRTLSKLTDIDICADDGAVLIERNLSSDGKSICKINGKPVTAGMLRDVANMLVDIHGQHDNQRILNSDEHYLFLDSFAENQKIKEEYYSSYKDFCRLKKLLDSKELSENEKSAKLDLLNYQINELEKAEIKCGEIAELKAKKKAAENSEKIITAVSSALASFEDEEEFGVCTRLSSAERELRFLNEYEAVSHIPERISALSEDAHDILSELKDFLLSFNFDENEQERIEERYALYSSLAKKYGDTEEKMLEFLENAKNELLSITFNEEQIERLEEELVEKQAELIEKGSLLTKSRQEAGIRLSEQVEKELAFLDMKSVKFKTEIEEDRYTSSGRDKIQFLISANIGEELRPLSKIASGGELSRIMLSIKNVFAEKDSIPTLIFDEIDTGISGRAAQKVSVKLREISKNHQVICVTHLAQIASKADNHYLIEKNIKNQRTFTSVNRLDKEGRKLEIARIIGGEITPYSLMTAEEMLEDA